MSRTDQSGKFFQTTLDKIDEIDHPESKQLFETIV